MGSADICIAVVGGEPSVRTMLGRLLRLADYDVVAFGCGEDFMAPLERRRPDCVVAQLQTAQLVSESNVIKLRGAQRANRVRLYQALGGSFDAEPPNGASAR